MEEKVKHACEVLMMLAQGNILMLENYRFISMNLEVGAVGDLYAADINNDMTLHEFIEMAQKVEI